MKSLVSVGLVYASLVGSACEPPSSRDQGALGVSIAPLASPISVGQTLTNQKFEWRSNQRQRYAAKYGQYSLALTAGRTYVIRTSNPSGGNTGDTYLYLLRAESNSAADIVAQDDNSAGQLQSQITFTPTTTQTFILRLRSVVQGKFGYCSLSLTENAPPPAGTLAPGDVLTGQYFAWEGAYASRSAGTYAQYNVFMTAGNRYTIETSAPAGGSTDTYLYLQNAVSDDAAAIVASDDDSGAGLASKLLYIPAVSGTYFVRVRAYAQETSGTTTLSATVQAPDPNATEILPDLLTWAKSGTYLYDAYIQNTGGQRLLRLSNAIANVGDGPMEVFGVVQPDGTTTAYQRVYRTDGFYNTYQVGVFIFDGHGDHGHFHLDNFARYSLRAVLEGDGVGDVVATGGKVSFCLMDVATYDASLPGTPASGVYTCSNQGISVGYADVYGAGLSGQEIDVTAIADGTYWLESICNPDGYIREKGNNLANNTARIKVQVAGNVLTVVP